MESKSDMVITKIIKVSNCHECPFYSEDYDRGVEDCSQLNEYKISYDILPSKGVHEKCPLLRENIRVVYNKNNQ